MAAENTNQQIRVALVDFLVTKGFTGDEASRIISQAWRDNPEVMNFKTTADLVTIFTRLKMRKIMIAVCTSDSREGTEQLLREENVEDLVDMVMCGDDDENVAKPAPDNIINICRHLKVKTEETFMIGDTPADTIMGKSARAGLTVGVLSGVGVTEDLADADIIVNNVTDVVDLIEKI